MSSLDASVFRLAVQLTGGGLAVFATIFSFPELRPSRYDVRKFRSTLPDESWTRLPPRDESWMSPG